MTKYLMILISVFCTTQVGAQGLLVKDIDKNTVYWPPVMEQVRNRLIQENDVYSYYQGDLTVLRQMDFKSLCVEFSNSAAFDEMKLRIEAGLVSPEGSKIPSVIDVSVVNSCLEL